jgi:hypothetical protein
MRRGVWCSSPFSFEELSETLYCCYHFFIDLDRWMLKAFYESAIAESAAENILNDCAGQYIAKHNKPAASSLVGR